MSKDSETSFGGFLIGGCIAIVCLSVAFIGGKIVFPLMKYLSLKLLAFIKKLLVKKPKPPVKEFKEQLATPDVFKDAKNLAPAKQINISSMT